MKGQRQPCARICIETTHSEKQHRESMRVAMHKRGPPQSHDREPLPLSAGPSLPLLFDRTPFPVRQWFSP
eukprot:1433394-Rhodomonas_salina.1